MKKIKSSEVLSLREIFSKAKTSSRWRGWILRAVAETFGILLAAGYLFYDSLFAGFIFFPFVFFQIKRRCRSFEKKRQEKLAVSFKDGMQAVVAALIAGYSVENAFRESLSEISLLYGDKSDIYISFSKISAKLNVNTNIEQAVAEFASESAVEEIDSFSQVLTYAKQSGGNLVEIIKNTTDTITEKIEVKREINTIISAKKLEQNIMNLVPLAIILYMRITSGEMFDKLYGNVFGISVMTVCLVLYFVAKLMADKITDIKV